MGSNTRPRLIKTKFASSRAAPGCRLPSCIPYLGDQLPGLLGAIKGAAEYEELVIKKYGGENPDPKYLEAKRRMGPQLIAHVLMILLIVAGNYIFFVQRSREGQAR